MLSDIIYAHWLECPVANMQSDLGNLGSAGRQAFKNLLG